MSDVETPSKSSKVVGISYEERIQHVSVIANPLASKKLTKKTYKLIKKAAKTKAIRRGVKEVVKCLRKEQEKKAVCFIAGDISPVDVIAHIPILCEEKNIPYVYVPSKVDLGAAAMSKRPTSCILVPFKADYEELYEEISKEVVKIQPTF